MRSKKAVINIITSLFLQVITICCGLIIPRLIIGTFGSNVNGLISSITQFLGYIALLEAGVGPVIKAALYGPIAQEDNEKIKTILKASEKFFRKIAYIFIVYILILCAFFPIIMQEQFDILFTLSLVIIISVSTFAEYFFGMTYRLYLEAEQRTYIVSIIQISTYILNTIIIVALIYFGVNIQIVKLSSAFIFLLRPILQNLYVKKKYNINFKEVKEEYKLEQKWDGLAQHIAAVAHNNTDITILTLFSSIKDVSVYSVYLLILNGVKNIILAFASGIDASFGSMMANGEEEHLRKSFKIYELFYFSVVTIVFSATLVLIVPFVKVYTYGITDANYIVPIFATFMVIAEFVWAIRQPYNELVKAAGHFKQTKIGAWIEAGVNIVISSILVINYGMVGVAIGTLIAMLIRTVEFIIHISKYILKRSIWISVKRMILIFVQVIVIVFVSRFLPEVGTMSYMSWIVYAIQIVGISSVVVAVSSLLIYKEDRKGIIDLIKRYVKK